MTGAMAEKMICLPNRKTMIENLMQSLLENVMRSKVTKKRNNSPLKNLKCKVERKNSVPGLLKNFSANHVTCLDVILPSTIFMEYKMPLLSQQMVWY